MIFKAAFTFNSFGLGWNFLILHFDTQCSQRTFIAFQMCILVLGLLVLRCSFWDCYKKRVETLVSADCMDAIHVYSDASWDLSEL